MNKNTIVTGLMGGMLVVSAMPAVAMAATSAPADNAVVVEDANQVIASACVKIANVMGEFSWDQGVSATNDQLRERLYKASDILCEKLDGTETGVITSIRVSGDVACAFDADVAEYAKKAPVQKILGCTCLGNPIDGRATANAEIKGFRLIQLIKDAQIADGVNTITFVAADGYRVSMPLSYVMQRYTVIVTVVNGEELSEAVGCSNQLWLGNTSARAYVQNIVEIILTAEEVVPAAPGQAGADAPNIGVTNGYVAA